MIVTKSSNYSASQYAKDEMSDIREIDSDLIGIVQCLQGRVRFGDGTDGSSGENIAGQWQVVSDTGTIDTEFTVVHTLGSVPVGYLVIKTNKGGVIYDSGTAWTTSAIYLKCSAANATVTLFLLR